MSLQEHYEEALNYFPKNKIVALCLQGSQNYKLDTSNSDIDSKLIILPTTKDLILSASPRSEVHVRDNDEHIDFKDLRLILNTFRKQNMNFVEILFSTQIIVNPLYADEWGQLVARREEIARMNFPLAVNAMRGVALEKYHAMEHRYPSKAYLIDTIGYDPKQVSHLVRIMDFMERYIKGEKYEDCLIPTTRRDFIMDIKQGTYDLNMARLIADGALSKINEMAEPYKHKNEPNIKMEEFLTEMQVRIMEKGIRGELKYAN